MTYYLLTLKYFRASSFRRRPIIIVRFRSGLGGAGVVQKKHVDDRLPRYQDMHILLHLHTQPQQSIQIFQIKVPSELAPPNFETCSLHQLPTDKYPSFYSTSYPHPYQAVLTAIARLTPSSAFHSLSLLFSSVSPIAQSQTMMGEKGGSKKWM